MTRNLPQIHADHLCWCKDEPAFAAVIGQPPQVGTKRYNRLAALDHDLRDLIPPPFGIDRKAPDPFGDLLEACRVIEQGWGRRHGRFAATVDHLDPHDPMQAAETAFLAVGDSIRAFGAPVHVVHHSGFYDPGDPVVLVSQSQIDGYKVDVTQFRNGRERLLSIEESLATNDKRRSAVHAARRLVDGHTHRVRAHLGEAHVGLIFHFEFNKDNPGQYRFCHMPREAS